MTDLTKLKELAERATPGPWSAVDYGCDEEGAWWFVDTTAGRADIFDDSGDPSPNHHDRARGERDMKFIAAANPQAILGLIERLEKAEQHWANENSNNMALIAEVERLTEALALAKQEPLYSTRRAAERYRWLRDLPRGTSHGDLTIMLAKNRPAPNQWCTDTIRGEALDAAIDAALEGGGR